MEDENKIGRPLKYKTKEELEKVINDYFANCLRNNQPYTMTGLGNAIGLCRQSLVEYRDKEEFGDSIKRAKSIVEQYLEEKLITSPGVTTGIIFNLKNNYNWKDKQEIDANVKTTEIKVELQD